MKMSVNNRKLLIEAIFYFPQIATSKKKNLHVSESPACVSSHISARSSLTLVSFMTRLLGVGVAVAAWSSSSSSFCSFRGRFLSPNTEASSSTLKALTRLGEGAEEFQDLMRTLNLSTRLWY